MQFLHAFATLKDDVFLWFEHESAGMLGNLWCATSFLKHENLERIQESLVTK